MSDTVSVLDPVRAFLAAGGPIVSILLVMSLIVLTVALVKLYQFTRAGVFRNRVARQAVALLRQGDREAAYRSLETSKTIRCRIVAKSIRGCMVKNSQDDSVREEVLRSAFADIEVLGSHLRILEIIASTAPLLGLLGTVLGMIDVFQELENSGNQVDPSLLSEGIWLALLTTAVGLTVALPTVLISSYFERILEVLAHDLENLIAQVFLNDFEQDSALNQS